MNGILGLGKFLPPDVRRNDWWPKATVDKWRQRMRMAATQEPVDDDARRVMEAQLEYADDPFSGAVERRVMSPDMNASDMEIAAARAALDDAGVDARDIDLVINESSTPDYLGTNTACVVHEALGLPRTALTVSVQAACNGFHQQVTLADALIASGRARRALLVQSCGLSRLLPYDQPFSPLFGDAATAQVLGPVGEGRGLLAAHHRTDGSLGHTLLLETQEGRWWNRGPVALRNANPSASHQMLVTLPRYARETVGGVLKQAELQPSQVDFVAMHQAFPWYRRVVQKAVGLEHARALDTFSFAGSVWACNVPLVLATAQQRGELNDGDLVVTQGGGSGMTYSSLALRWGR
ncbi:MAG: 3-oxoacyl-[acyl-carrier-protein] synthase III C-terminal domain-containing protein [Myxococcota bacterium]